MIDMLWLMIFFAPLAAASENSSAPSAPKMTPELFPAVMEKREVVVQVTPKPSSGPGKDFQLFCAFHVRAPMEKTRKALLDFSSYQSLSPALTQVRYESRRHLLWISGSVLTLPFSTVMKIEEHSPQWVHFSALWDEHRSTPADLFLKPVGLAGHAGETLVYLTGTAHSDSILIPDVTIRKAAELLVSVAADQFRKRIESAAP
jgi:hypothetical protein